VTAVAAFCFSVLAVVVAVSGVCVSVSDFYDLLERIYRHAVLYRIMNTHAEHNCRHVGLVRDARVCAVYGVLRSQHHPCTCC
jgi:hypothetical protein